MRKEEVFELKVKKLQNKIQKNRNLQKLIRFPIHQHYYGFLN